MYNLFYLSVLICVTCFIFVFINQSFLMSPNRQQSDCGREPEVDPGSGMDPHPPLLHLYARLG